MVEKKRVRPASQSPVGSLITPLYASRSANVHSLNPTSGSGIDTASLSMRPHYNLRPSESAEANRSPRPQLSAGAYDCASTPRGTPIPGVADAGRIDPAET